MIVVLASRRDREAHRLVGAWSAQDVRLLTPDDLSVPGWRVNSTDPGAGRLVVAGEVVDQANVSGVVTRLMTVTPDELIRIQEPDRVYAAREMTAFLAFWISTLTCPMLNPPGAVSLCGPGWRAERWLAFAATLGIDVRPHLRQVRPPGAAGEGMREPASDGAWLAEMTITVVGDRRVPVGSAESSGLPDEDQAADAARRLAAAAGVPMMTFGFARTATGPVLVSAGPRVDLSHPDVRAAMLQHLEGRPAQALTMQGHA
jgi:hypothetical protein